MCIFILNLIPAFIFAMPNKKLWSIFSVTGKHLDWIKILFVIHWMIPTVNWDI